MRQQGRGAACICLSNAKTTTLVKPRQHSTCLVSSFLSFLECGWEPVRCCLRMDERTKEWADGRINLLSM